jgi:DNA polymerase-1
MDKETRGRAKAVNFGIVYGISAFGLAAQLGIPQAEAKAYIERYFARYQGVKAFIEKTLEQTRREGSCARCSAACGPFPTSRAATPTSADSPSAPPSTRRCKAPRPTSSSWP